ncbi:MAG: hypothetical protein QXU74_04130 [Candidatus Aenigmatarchaeota archaeon]
MKYVVSGSVGAGIGYVYGLWSQFSAKANVAVRPELTKVDWFTALLSGHLQDWAFYHYPTESTLLAAGIGAALLSLYVYITSE